MKIEEALNYADEWTNGHTFYEGMQGWRVVCATLAAEVRRLRAEPDVVSENDETRLKNIENVLEKLGAGDE